MMSVGLAWYWPNIRPGCARCARQPEHALCDDVPLHLGGAGVDAGRARPEVLVLPAATVDGARRTALEVAIGALHVEREVLHALVDLAPHELEARALGAGLPVPHDLAHVLVGEAAEDLRLDEALGEALARARIGGGRLPVAADAAGEVEDLAHLALDACVGRRAAPLVGECRDDYRPAPVHLADDVLARHADVVEEDLVEPGHTRHLDERPDGDPGGLH